MALAMALARPWWKWKEGRVHVDIAADVDADADVMAGVLAIPETLFLLSPRRYPRSIRAACGPAYERRRSHQGDTGLTPDSIDHHLLILAALMRA